MTTLSKSTYSHLRLLLNLWVKDLLVDYTARNYPVSIFTNYKQNRKQQYAYIEDLLLTGVRVTEGIAECEYPQCETSTFFVLA